MSVPPSEGSTSPTNLPDEPVVGILGTAVEGRGTPEGFGISDPVDVRLTEAIAQARTLATDEESVLEFPTPMTAPVELPAPPSSSKPLVPLIGGITLVTKDEWSAWTGGKPNHTWTGLDGSIALLEHTSPNQLRPVYVSAAQKGYNFRRAGHKISFKPSDDLISFQNVVWDHLKDTGMDSIAYLKDPTDDTKMTNVIKAHARYTVQSAKLLAETQVQLYDKYDRTNDMAARTYLLASLSTELSNKVTEKLDDSDSFPVVWLQFLKSIQSTSIERFEDLRSIIKARLPSQYSGENLEQLAAHFRKDANELTTAGQYDHNLTLSMLKIFLLAGGSGNEDFRFPLRSVKQKLEQALLDIGFKDKEAANLHMQMNKLTYKDICAHAEDAYRTLFDRKEWPPARHTRDSKAPPAAFGNMATPITRAEVLNLIQSKPSTNGAGSAKKGVCHKCNKPGHWSRECPENNSKGKGRNGGGNEKPKDVKSSWKSAPPPSGAPQTKQANGKTFNWCASCKRWTTTHATATHTGSKKGADGANGGGTAINNVSLAFDPSVWTTEIKVAPSVTDVLFVLRTAVTRILPVLIVLTTYVMAIFSVPFAKTMWTSTLENFQLTMAHFNAVDWTQVNAIVRAHIMVIRPQVSQFLGTHQEALIAPLLWILMGTVVLFWLPKDFSTPPEPDSKEVTTRRHRRALKQHYRKGTRRAKAPQVGSIRSHGLHRKYPINLRSMGHYIRSNAPTLIERQQQVQLNTLHSKVATLLQRVDSLKRFTPQSSTHWTCRHCNDTIVHGPTQPCPSLRDTNRSPLESTKHGFRRCDISDAYHDAPLRPPRRRARGPPKSSSRYCPIPPSGFQGLGNHQWTSKQLQAARKMAMQVNMAKIPNGNYSTILRMALQSTDRFRESLPKTATFPVIWDSGASISITPDRKDFVGPINTPGPITQLQGIAKGLRIEGQGHVLWAMQDTLGNLRIIKVPAYLVSRIKVRLLSTTSLLQAYPEETITIEAHQLTLSGTSDAARGQLIARVNPENNLPTSDAHRSSDTPRAVAALNITLNTVHESNLNLTEAEKELLRWHHRLGHLSFRKIQFIMRTGVLSRSESHRSLHTAACQIVNPPKCAACQYGKQHQRPAPAKISSAIKDRAGVLKAENLVPGQQVSIDQFICGTKGRWNKHRTSRLQPQSHSCFASMPWN